MRYTIRRERSDSAWWDQGPLVPQITVDGPARIDTGLVDRHGHAIERVQPPIGFGRDAEW